MQHSNIEIKARFTHQEEVRKILNSLNADFKGIDNQIDTYFNVPFGRLKLREGNIENHLIQYSRTDGKGPKQSDILLYKSTSKSSLKEILVKSLGILVVVDKQREIYFIDNVKFHIDLVKHLGSFIEIEAIDYDGSIGKNKLLKQCRSFMNILDINDNDLISYSYSDLLLNKR